MSQASDIPSGGFSSAFTMARALASYMDCPHAVQRAVRREFSHIPAIDQIRRYRVDHLANKSRRPERIEPRDRYDHSSERDALDPVNAAFLAALRLEGHGG